MANIKLGSGCDFLGYYMFHGGTNPKGAAGFLNEGQTPKRSYDFQAPLGEFGQVRESYRRLRTLHEFVKSLRAGTRRKCPVSLQDGQDRIGPSDSETLRYAVRSDGERGFVSIDNFQDHARVPSRHGEQIDVTTGTGERIRCTRHRPRRGGELRYCRSTWIWTACGSSAPTCCSRSPVLRVPGRPFRTFVFLKPDGMDELTFHFEGDIQDVTVGEADFERFMVRDAAEIVCVTRALARADDGVGRRPRLRRRRQRVAVRGRRWVDAGIAPRRKRASAAYPEGLLGSPRPVEPVSVYARLRRLHADRYEIALPAGMGRLFRDQRQVADVMLNIAYQGDIGWLFCGDMVPNRR